MYEQQDRPDFSECPERTLCTWCIICPKHPLAPCPTALMDYLDSEEARRRHEYGPEPF